MLMSYALEAQTWAANITPCLVGLPSQQGGHMSITKANDNFYTVGWSCFSVLRWPCCSVAFSTLTSRFHFWFPWHHRVLMASNLSGRFFSVFLLPSPPLSHLWHGGAPGLPSEPAPYLSPGDLTHFLSIKYHLHADGLQIYIPSPWSSRLFHPIAYHTSPLARLMNVPNVT